MSVPILSVAPTSPTTLTEARDEVRRRLAAGDVPAEGLVVELAGGDYPLTGSFHLGPEDSGTHHTPVIWRARPGEAPRLLGGVLLHGFTPVTDAAIREHLAPAARDHVVQIDLRAHGVDAFGDPVDVRGTKGDHIGKFHYDGDRPSRWVDEADPWVHGYWFWDWSDQRQRVESIDTESRVIAVEPPYHNYGYRVGQWFYAYNLLCELDQPGEFYVDRQAGILYFWPPAAIDGAEVAVSVTDTLVALNGAAHVRLEGLTFEYGRDTALTVAAASDVCVEGCTFRNLGGWAARVDGGQDVTVAACHIEATGNGGIYLSGGDRVSLTPSGHVVEDCHIHHYGRVNRMYQPAVQIVGVGQRVSHNHIHDAPHMAVQFAGNDHIIEFNDVHHVCLESNDAGAVYSGRDWTWRGTVIRYNKFWEITGFEARGCVGVYLDDMLCGTHVHGNLFWRVTRATMIGGGRDCRFENNLYVDCTPCVHLDARAMNWAAYHVDTTMKDRLDEMPIHDPVWAERYPELLTIWADEPAAPKSNIIRRNVSQGGTFDGVRADDVGLAGTPPEDFTLREDSPAWALGFEAIPEAAIGPRR